MVRDQIALVMNLEFSERWLRLLILPNNAEIITWKNEKQDERVKNSSNNKCISRLKEGIKFFFFFFLIGRKKSLLINIVDHFTE